VLYQQPTAVIKALVEVRRLPSWLPAAYRAIEEYLSLKKLSPTGPPFARYTIDDDKATVEAGFPVAVPIIGDGYIVASTLPHGPVAIAVHSGGYDTLGETYRVVTDWLGLHGYAERGPMWEVYLTGPGSHPDPDTWRTEVVVPYQAL
jgi:effector-binding domain-containing protein